MKTRKSTPQKTSAEAAQQSQPVLAWPIPHAGNRPELLPAKAFRKRSRRRRVSKLQLIIGRDRIERMKACAHCMGLEPKDFLYHAVLAAIAEAEETFGATGAGMVGLTRRQRADLASKFWPLNFRLACMHKRTN